MNIIACDNAPPAIRAAQKNLASAGMLGQVILEKTSFEDWNVAVNKGLLIINPPYGERMEETDIQAIYRSIGNMLKHKYSGSEAWIFSGTPRALKHVGLRADKRLNLYNGPIQCKFQQYTLYEGTRKGK